MPTTVRVGTWNMQGAPGKWLSVFKTMEDHDVAAMALQECGVPTFLGSPSFIPIHAPAGSGDSMSLYSFRHGTRTRFKEYSVLWLKWGLKHDMDGPVNPRCSLAVVTRGRRSIRKTDMILDDVKGLERRPCIGVNSTAVNTAWFYCVHAPASSAAAATDAGFIERINEKRPRWIVAGDYNCPPSQLRTRIDADIPIISSRRATQRGGKTLDYVVASQDYTGRYVNAGGHTSDHLMQIFSLTR